MNTVNGLPYKSSYVNEANYPQDTSAKGIKPKTSLWENFKTIMGKCAYACVFGCLKVVGAVTWQCLHCYYAVKRRASEPVFREPYTTHFDFENDEDLWEWDTTSNKNISSSNEADTCNCDECKTGKERKILFISED